MSLSELWTSQLIYVDSFPLWTNQTLSLQANILYVILILQYPLPGSGFYQSGPCFFGNNILNLVGTNCRGRINWEANRKQNQERKIEAYAFFLKYSLYILTYLFWSKWVKDKSKAVGWFGFQAAYIRYLSSWRSKWARGTEYEYIYPIISRKQKYLH